jgi:hypothetical protein
MNFWKKLFGKFRAASLKNESNPLLVQNQGLYGHKPQSFPPKSAPKMPEIQQLFFGLRLVSRIFQHPAIQPKYSIPLADFFNKLKCASQ